MKEGDANRCLLLAGHAATPYYTLLRVDPAVTLSPFFAIIPDGKAINSPDGASPRRRGDCPPRSAG